MSRFALAWAWLILLVALDIIVPWFFLSNVARMSGAFLFWTVWILFAILSAFIVIANWREVKP